MKKRTALLWFLIVLITLSSVVYQRLTGPTHPLRGGATVGEQTIRYKLLRTHDTDADARIELGVSDPGTTALLVAGGLVLGPIVQKLAFGAYWTGFPLGRDLTDTKTAAAVLVWVIALCRGRGNRGRGSRGWILAAAVVTLAIYLVPHSTLGSEIDYTQTS